MKTWVKLVIGAAVLVATLIAGSCAVLVYLVARPEPETPESTARMQRLDEADRRMAERDAAKRRAADAARKAADAEWAASPAGAVHKKHPTWSREVCDAIAQKKVFVGMTKEQARLGWGKPTSTANRTTADGSVEVWCYDSVCGEKLGFVGDKLVQVDTRN